MTSRERFIRTMTYQPVDRRPLYVVGIWPDTLKRWKKEGLPEGVDVHQYLGLQPIRSLYVGPRMGLWPPFEEKIIEERDNYRISIDGYGRKVKTFLDHTSMPEWLEFPVKNASDLERIIEEHFVLETMDLRFGEDWEKRIGEASRTDAVRVIDGGCYYWTLRSLAGVEVASYLLYDATSLVEKLFQRYLTIVLEGIKRTCSRIQVDCLGFGEDIAYKTGPLISPQMFRQLILPCYQQAVNLARSYGVKLTWFDSDGDLRNLLPDLLSAGINTFAPCEVAAGMDPVQLRARWGRQVRMIGGIDKREVARGKQSIDSALKRCLPLIREGGFIPAIDHSVSSDISLENYCYFLQKLEKFLLMV